MSKRTVAKNWEDIQWNRFWLVVSVVVLAFIAILLISRTGKTKKETEAIRTEIGYLYGELEATQMPDKSNDDDPEPIITPEHYRHADGAVICEDYCWHEVAHKYYFEDLNDDERQEFEYAVRRWLHKWTQDVWIRSDTDDTGHYTYEAQTHPLLHLVVTFPCFFDDCLEGGWGGYDELYADIFEFYEGGYREMPSELDWAYGYRETLEYYYQYRPEHFNAEFCADWAFRQRNEQESFEFCKELYQ